LIENFSDQVVDLNNFKDALAKDVAGRLVLSNIYIVISKEGQLSVAQISDAKQAIAKFDGKDASPTGLLTFVQIEDRAETAEVQRAETLLNAGANTGTEPVGGIDFNPATIKMEINKQNGGVKVEFDPKLLEEIRSQGIEGFVPIILNIQRVQNVVPLLSQNVDQSGVGLASLFENVFFR
jgi:hypothetical protein